MHHHTELSFIDEFRWISHLHYLKNGWHNAVLRWCMLQSGPPYLHYYCAVVLHSCILLTPFGHSSNHEYHSYQLTRQSSCVSNFYRTFKVFIWLSLVQVVHENWEWDWKHSRWRNFIKLIMDPQICHWWAKIQSFGEPALSQQSESMSVSVTAVNGDKTISKTLVFIPSLARPSVRD